MKIVHIAVAAACIAGASPVAAQVTSGSAALLSNRDCTVAASSACPASANLTRDFVGGPNTGLDASRENMNGTGASAVSRVGFEDGSFLPVLGVGSFAGATTRTGATAIGFNSFTYSGDAAINLALDGVIDYANSGQGSTGPQDSYGAGVMSASLAVLPVSSLDELGASPTANDIYTWAFQGCSRSALGSTSANSAGTSAGSHQASFNLTAGCASSAITINPGDTFIVLGLLQGVSNRSGYTDALHTFHIAIDPVLTVFANTGTSVGSAYLARNVSGGAVGSVPESTTWAMLALGFGATGAAIRMQRRRTITAAA